MSDRTRLLAATWALVVPVALVAISAVALVVPAIVHNPSGPSLPFLSQIKVKPDPLKQWQYLVILMTPGLLAIAAVLSLRLGRIWRSSADTKTVVQLAIAAQLGLATLIGICWAIQQSIYQYFRPWQLILAALGVVLTPLLLRAPSIRKSSLDRRWAAWLATGIAVVVTLMLSSTGIQKGSNVARAQPVTIDELAFVQDELSSVAAGRTPLVDFNPQYSSLMPYVLAPAISTVSWELGWFTALMAALSALALLAVFVGLKQLTGSAVRALPLYLLIIWFGLYTLAQSPEGAVSSIMTYNAQLPIRELGPLVTFAVLLWSLVSPTRWRIGILGLTVALAVLNNFDWGLPTLIATLVALVCSLARRGSLRAAVISSLVTFAAGAVVALLAFTALTVAVSGKLPDLSGLWLFSWIMGSQGLTSIPLPGLFGFQIVILLTFLACVTIGFIRALVRINTPDRRDRLNTAALTYVGIMGAGTAEYYVSRSLAEVLVAIFLAWALAVVLLTREAVRYLRDPSTPALGSKLTLIPTALLIGHVVLMATMFHDSYSVFKQPERVLTGGSPRILDQITARRLALRCTTSSEPTMFFHKMGHVISGRTGRDNLFPYNHPNSLVTELQLRRVRGVLNRARVNTVIVGPVWKDISRMLKAEGFRLYTARPSSINPSESITVLTRDRQRVPPSCPVKPAST